MTNKWPFRLAIGVIGASIAADVAIVGWNIWFNQPRGALMPLLAGAFSTVMFWVVCRLEEMKQAWLTQHAKQMDKLQADIAVSAQMLKIVTEGTIQSISAELVDGDPLRGTKH